MISMPVESDRRRPLGGGFARPWTSAAALVAGAVLMVGSVAPLGAQEAAPDAAESAAAMPAAPALVPPGSLPLGEWIDPLEKLDLERDVIVGQWQRKEEGLFVSAEAWARVMLPVILQGSYDLEVEFTRHRGWDTVALGLPVGNRACLMNFSGHVGRVGGLEKVGQRYVNAPENPATRRPSTLENDRRYKALVRVRTRNGLAKIDVLLDQQPYVQWSGEVSSLGLHELFDIPEWSRPMLISQGNEVTFHRVALRPIDGWAAPIEPGEIRRLRGHRGPVTCAALSFDGHIALTASSDTTVRVWDLRNGAALGRLDGPATQARGLAFHPDSLRVVAADADGAVSVRPWAPAREVFTVGMTDLLEGWNYDTGRHRGVYRDAETPVRGMAVSADRRRVAVALPWGEIAIWDTISGNETHRISDLPYKPQCVALSPLGRKLLAAAPGEDHPLLLDLATRQGIPLEGHAAEITAIAFAPDGHHVATADREGAILLRELESDKPARRLEGHAGAVRAMAFSRYGGFLLSGDDQGTMLLWKGPGKEPVHRFDGHQGAVRSLRFVNHVLYPGSERPNQYALSGGDDGTVRLWRMPASVAELDEPPVLHVAQVGDPEKQIPVGQWGNLLSRVQLPADSVLGQWERTREGLLSGEGRFERVALPVQIEGDYDLVAEFTRHTGGDSVVFVFPVGSQTCTLWLSGWGGRGHGLGVIDGMEPDNVHNPTVRYPGLLANGHPYQVLIAVRTEKETADIEVSLDGLPLLRWKGNQSLLGISPAWQMPDSRQPGFGKDGCTVTFHRVFLRPVSGKATWTPRKPTADPDEFTTRENGPPPPAAGTPELSDGRPQVTRTAQNTS